MRTTRPLVPFAGDYDEFDWDEAKRERTLRERGIDFADVARLFFGRKPYFRRREERGGETRWQAFGYLGSGGTLLSVVYTEREDGALCRLISVRTAHRKEREEYDATVPEG
jgi:uncharacterized protein